MSRTLREFMLLCLLPETETHVTRAVHAVTWLSSSLTTAPPFPLEVLSEMNELLLHAPRLERKGDTRGLEAVEGWRGCRTKGNVPNNEVLRGCLQFL